MVVIVRKVQRFFLVRLKVRHDAPLVGDHVLGEPFCEDQNNVGILGQALRLFPVIIDAVSGKFLFGIGELLHKLCAAYVQHYSADQVIETICRGVLRTKYDQKSNVSCCYHRQDECRDPGDVAHRQERECQHDCDCDQVLNELAEEVFQRVQVREHDQRDVDSSEGQDQHLGVEKETEQVA